MQEHTEDANTISPISPIGVNDRTCGCGKPSTWLWVGSTMEASSNPEVNRMGVVAFCEDHGPNAVPGE